MSQEPATESVEQQPRRGRRRTWVIGAIVLFIVVDALLYWRYTQNWESTDDAQIDGRVHEISARIPGTIVKRSVDDNQYVEAGAVLAELDPRQYQVAVQHAKAAVAEAEADAAASRSEIPVTSITSDTQLSGAEAAVAEAESAIATAEQQAQAARARLSVAQAQLRQAKADYDRAAGDVKRYRPLVEKEEISQQQFDVANTEAEAAQARVDAAEAQLQEVNHAIEVADHQVAEQQARLARVESDVRSASAGPQRVAATRARAKAAEAKVETARAQLAQAKLDFDHTVIRALVSGVARRNVELGESVQVGQPVVTIVPLDDIWVNANFKENQLENIRPGQPVQVSVDAYGGKTYAGHVDSISPATGARFSLLPPENATGNYVKVVQRVPVKIVLDPDQDDQHLLRPGMSVVPRVRVQ